MDSKIVIKELLKDPAFGNTPANGLPILEDLVEKSLAALETTMKEPATLQTIVGSKLTVLKTAVDVQFVKKYCEALGLGEMGEGMDAMFSMLIAQFEDLVGNTQAFLKANGMSEEQTLLELQVSPEMTERVLQSTATIEDVVREEPAVIFKTTTRSQN